jgi:hypothetical protein
VVLAAQGHEQQGARGDGDGDAEMSGGGGCVGQQGDAATLHRKKIASRRSCYGLRVLARPL